MEYKVGDRYEIVEVISGAYGSVGDIVIIDSNDGEWWGKNQNDFWIKLIGYKLKKLEETMFKVGDIINNGDDTVKVLAICGDLTALSYSNKFKTHCNWMTKEELEEGGYKLKDSKVELSMDEIATKFNVDVKDLKIKKED